MPKPESVLGNETRKILWDSKIQTILRISSWTTDLITINKKKKRERELAELWTLPSWQTTEWKKKREKYSDIARGLKKLWKHEYDTNTSCTWYVWNNPQKLCKEDWKCRKSEDNPRPFKLKQCLDQPEYWGEPWRMKETCCAAQILVKEHQLPLVWKIRKE